MASSSCPSGSVSPTWACPVVTAVVKHSWRAAVDGHKLFRRDRHRGRGSGVALYVREDFDFLELNDSDNRDSCLWVGVSGKASKADVMVGVC